MSPHGWASAEIFPGGNFDILLILFRLLTMHCKWTFIKRCTFSTPQKMPPRPPMLWQGNNHKKCSFLVAMVEHYHNLHKKLQIFRARYVPKKHCAMVSKTPLRYRKLYQHVKTCWYYLPHSGKIVSTITKASANVLGALRYLPTSRLRPAVTCKKTPITLT